jgi:choline transport protein
MAEEIENASTIIPRALIITVFVNGILGYAMLFLVFFCMGSIEEILAMEGGFSFVSMFYSITRSAPGASVLVSRQFSTCSQIRRLLTLLSLARHALS